jgi:predicted small lipoprotein YifL
MKNKNIYKSVSVMMIIALFAVITGCGKKESPKTEEKAPPKTTENKTTENKTTENKTADTKTTDNSAGVTYSYDVVNNTGVTLVDVFVSPAETDHWGKDILPNDLFENGSTIKVTIPPDYGTTCLFDMKITDAAGGHITFTNIDICKLVKLKINADGTFDYVATK